MNVCDDNSIIQKILHGNVDSYELIIKKYNRKVYGYIFNFVKCEHDTEELVQETFVKAYRNLEKYDISKNFSIWLLRVARNNVMDYFKKQKKESYYELDNNVIYDVNNNSINDPSKIIEYNEWSKELDKIIQSLPEKYKTLIILKYFEELKYEEIATRLDMPLDKVKWRLHQARKKLIIELQKLSNSEGRTENYGL